MEPTDYLQRIRPYDQWLFDESGNLVGARNPKGQGDDLRPGVTLVTDPVTGARYLVSRDDVPIPYPRVLGQGLDIAGSRTVTGTTNETSVYQLVVPANSMGSNGSLRVSTLFGYTNSANNKTLKIKFGNSSPMVVQAAPTTSSTASLNSIVTIQNMGATNAQETHASLIASIGATGTALITGAFDTTVDQLLEVTVQLASGGESVSLRRALVELIRP